MFPNDDSYTWSEWIIFFCYIVLGLVGAVGNGFILLVIRRRKLRTTTMSLIANQAVSDLSCGLIYLSLWALCSEKVVSSGLTGLTTCEVAYTIKVTTFFVSVFTMVIISIDRFRKLCYYPSKNLGLSTQNCIIIIWIAGLATSVLCMFHFRVSLFFTSERLVGCRLAYKVENVPFFELHYNFLLIILISGIAPLLITTYMYYRIVKKLKDRQVVGTQVDNNQSEAIFNKNRKRTIHMLISTLVFYFLLCGPIYANFFISYFIVRILPEDCGPGTHEALFYLIAYFLSVTSICVNPVIYCYYNSEFRGEAKRIGYWILRREMEEVSIHTIGTTGTNGITKTNSMYNPNVDVKLDVQIA